MVFQSIRFSTKNKPCWTSLLTFISGSLAHAELYLTIAAVARRFDWELHETRLDDIICKHDFFVAVGDLNSKGVRARLTVRQ